MLLEKNIDFKNKYKKYFSSNKNFFDFCNSFFLEKDNIINEFNKLHLKSVLENNDEPIISLGAGVSIPYGLKNWNDMVDNLWLHTQFPPSIKNNIYLNVESPLTRIQVLKDYYDLTNNLNDYYRLIWNSTKPSPVLPPNSIIKSIVNLIKCKKINKRVLTYNIDNILENELNGVSFSVKSSSKRLKKNTNAYIFHIHGQIKSASDKNLILSLNEYTNMLLSI